MHRHLLALAAALAAALLLCPASLCAQSGQVVHSLNWIEVNGANEPVPNPNGVLEPGEGARLIVTATYAPSFGSQLSQWPVPGGIATVKGLAETNFLITPATAELGTWTHLGTIPGFEAFWFPSADNIGGFARQPSLGGAWLPNPVNPVEGVWQAVWWPQSYLPRSVTMQMAPLLGPRPHLWGQYGEDPTTGHPLLIQLFANGQWDSTQIPIIPAPGAALVILPAFLAARRRRPRLA